MKNLKQKISTAWKNFVYWWRKDRNCPDYILIFQIAIWNRLPHETKIRAGLEGWTIMKIHKGQVYVFNDCKQLPPYFNIALQYCDTALDMVNKTVLKSREYWACKRFYDVVCAAYDVELMAVCEGYRNDLAGK